MFADMARDTFPETTRVASSPLDYWLVAFLLVSITLAYVAGYVTRPEREEEKREKIEIPLDRNWGED